MAMTCGYGANGSMNLAVVAHVFLFDLAAFVFCYVYPNNSQNTCIKMTHDKQLV